MIQLDNIVYNNLGWVWRIIRVKLVNKNDPFWEFMATFSTERYRKLVKKVKDGSKLGNIQVWRVLYIDLIVVFQFLKRIEVIKWLLKTPLMFCWGIQMIEFGEKLPLIWANTFTIDIYIITIDGNPSVVEHKCQYGA